MPGIFQMRPDRTEGTGRYMAEFRFALRQMAPVLCGYLFLGLAFGLLLQQAGYG